MAIVFAAIAYLVPAIGVILALVFVIRTIAFAPLSIRDEDVIGPFSRR
jgi:hypothetical protein